MAVAVWWLPAPARAADEAASREYQIKAAILYNVLKFVEWPQDKTPDSNEPMIIGLIGHDPFLNSFDPILEKNPEGKPVAIRRFPGFNELEKTGPSPTHRSRPFENRTCYSSADRSNRIGRRSSGQQRAMVF